jgi:hypothetical protein
LHWDVIRSVFVYAEYTLLWPARGYVFEIIEGYPVDPDVGCPRTIWFNLVMRKLWCRRNMERLRPVIWTE